MNTEERLLYVDQGLKLLYLEALWPERPRCQVLMW